MMTNKERCEAMQAETLDLLRNKAVESTLIEHWLLLDEAWREFDGLPQPTMEGKGLRYIIERATLPVSENDLLLARFVDRIPTPEEEARLAEIWSGERHPNKNPISCVNGSHNTLDAKHIIEYGIPGYIERAEARLARAKDEGAEEAEIIWLEGMVEVYRAHLLYIERYAEAARAAGRDDLAEVCDSLTVGAPKTFREAMQLMLFVLTVYYIYGGGFNSTLTYGRLDDILCDLYEADIAAGRLTREDAGYIIDDFNCKANLTLGRGEHQMADPSQGGHTTGWERSNVYDDPTYVMIGGYSNLRDHTKNPLTRLFLERIVPRHENPVYIYRYTKEDSEDMLMLLSDKLRQNSSILVYNDETMIPAMNHIVTHEEALDYTLHACNWPDLPSSITVNAYGGPIPKMIMHALLDGENLRRDYASVDELLAVVGENFRHDARACFDWYRDRYCSGKKLPPSGVLMLLDCFTDGAIENARSITDGGCKNPSVWALLRNIGTAADIITALDEIVYKKKICTLDEMAKALAADFEGTPELLAHCRRAPKFGCDNEVADAFAVRIMKMLLDIIDEENPIVNGAREVKNLSVTITDMWHVGEGYGLCATPDGRRNHAPLSENLSPTVGFAESATALLNSVSKLPFDRIHSGAFNLRLRKDIVEGDEGLIRMYALLSTYLENGGMQLQISVADTEELRRAQECPEQYKDLMVRITGYSAVFTDMTRNAQNEIIRRDEMGA